MEQETVTVQGGGTTQNAEGNQTPSAESGTPKTETQVSSEKIYTQEQLDTMLQTVRSEAGREKAELRNQMKALEGERDSVKAELEANKSDIESLEGRLEALAKDDPDKKELAQMLKTAREEQRKLRVQDSNLKAREQTIATREEKVSAFEVDLFCEEVLEESTYEGADAKKLAKICKDNGIKSKEAIAKLAESLWTKKPAVPTQQNLKPYPGITTGGTNLSDQEFIEKFNKGELNTPADLKKAKEILANLR